MLDEIRATQDLDRQETERLSRARLLQLPLGRKGSMRALADRLLIVKSLDVEEFFQLGWWPLVVRHG